MLIRSWKQNTDAKAFGTTAMPFNAVNFAGHDRKEGADFTTASVGKPPGVGRFLQDFWDIPS